MNKNEFHNYKYTKIDSLKISNDCFAKDDLLSKSSVKEDAIRKSLQELFRDYEYECLDFDKCFNEIRRILELDSSCAEARFFEIYNRKKYVDFFAKEYYLEARFLKEIVENKYKVSECDNNANYAPIRYYLYDKETILRLVTKIFYKHLEDYYVEKIKNIAKYYNMSKYCNKLYESDFKEIEELFEDLAIKICTFDKIYKNDVKKYNFLDNIIFRNELCLIDAKDPSITYDRALSLKYEHSAIMMVKEIGADYKRYESKGIGGKEPLMKIRHIYSDSSTSNKEETKSAYFTTPVSKLPILNKEGNKNIRSVFFNKLSMLLSWIFGQKNIFDSDNDDLNSEPSFENKLDELIKDSLNLLSINYSSSVLYKELQLIYSNKSVLKTKVASSSLYELFIQTRLYQYIEPYLQVIIREDGRLTDKQTAEFTKTFKKLNELLELKIQSLSKQKNEIENIEFEVINKEIDKALEEISAK